MNLDGSLRKKRGILSLLIIAAFSYGLIFFVPSIAGKELQDGDILPYQHAWVTNRYRLEVREGNIYEFSFQSDPFWEMDPDIRLFSNSLKIVGVHVNYPESFHRSIRFLAEHDGHYYVIMGISESGFFSVSFELLSTGVIPLYEKYINPTMMSLIIIPSVIFLLGIILVVIPRKTGTAKKSTSLDSNMDPNIFEKPTDPEEIPSNHCANCGAVFSENQKFCPYCGDRMD